MPNMDQALTDEDIVSGHPGNTPEEGEYQEGDSQVTVKIDGKEYLLSADQAEAFNAREREYKRKLSEQGAELGRLRRQTSQPIVQQPVVQQPVDEDEDVDVALFKDPKGYLKKFEDRIINKVTTTYQRKIAMDTFWSDFYDANPDLKKAKVLAEAILARNSHYFGPMHPSECIEELASMTRDEIAKLGVAPIQQDDNRPARRTTVESPTIRRPAPPAKPAAKPKTVVDIMAERKKARMNARMGKATA